MIVKRSVIAVSYNAGPYGYMHGDTRFVWCVVYNPRFVGYMGY